jgi:hypothetical protein
MPETTSTVSASSVASSGLSVADGAASAIDARPVRLSELSHGGG